MKLGLGCRLLFTLSSSRKKLSSRIVTPLTQTDESRVDVLNYLSSEHRCADENAQISRLSLCLLNYDLAFRIGIQ